MTRASLIYLNPSKHNQGLLFMVNLERCDESCNTLDNFSSWLCVWNKKEGVNLNVFNTITRINESKTLTKQISCNCKYNFESKNVIQIKSGIRNSVDVCAKI